MTEPRHKPPRDFAHWLGPWHIGPISWIDDAGNLVERDHWMRPYQEKSHCDTPGCCEMRSVKVGVAISGVRLAADRWTIGTDLDDAIDAFLGD